MKNHHDFWKNQSTTSQILFISRIIERVHPKYIRFQTHRKYGVNITSIWSHKRNWYQYNGSPTWWYFVPRFLLGYTLAPEMLIISFDYVSRLSINLLKENSFMLKKGKRQTISRRNYDGHRLHRWSSASHKYTCPSWISTDANSKIYWPLHECKKKFICFKWGAISSGKLLKFVDQVTYLGSNISSSESDVNIH